MTVIINPQYELCEATSDPPKKRKSQIIELAARIFTSLHEFISHHPIIEKSRHEQ